MLEEIAKHHKEWIRIVKQLGGDDFSEDIVQEMYLKIHKYSTPDKCINNGILNKYYIYLTLKSILYTYLREKKRIPKVNLNEVYELSNELPDEQIEAYNRLSQKITDESENWHWYDKQVFDSFRDKKTSFRKMSAETGISFVSLFHTVKKCKRKIQVKLKEDIEDYNNNNFDLI